MVRALRLVTFLIRIALDGHRVSFAQPSPQVDLPAAVRAKRHRPAFGRIELLLADRTTNERHSQTFISISHGAQILVLDPIEQETRRILGRQPLLQFLAL
jgi:hypothetical protein